jgi:hypothetical protein
MVLESLLRGWVLGEEDGARWRIAEKIRVAAVYEFEVVEVDLRLENRDGGGNGLDTVLLRGHVMLSGWIVRGFRVEME